MRNNRLVAVLDILGFSNLIRNEDLEDIALSIEMLIQKAQSPIVYITDTKKKYII